MKAISLSYEQCDLLHITGMPPKSRGVCGKRVMSGCSFGLEATVQTANSGLKRKEESDRIYKINRI